MSWEATAWVKQTRGHGQGKQKMVLLMLAEAHNAKDVTRWPSQDRLAQDCEIPVRSVRRHLRNLMTQGFISVDRKGNQFQPTIYSLKFDVFLDQSEPASLSKCTGQFEQVNRSLRASEPVSLNRVNRSVETSEPVTPRMTSLPEPTITTSEEKEIDKESSAGIPEWFEVLSQDPRWHGKNPDRYIRAVQKDFDDVNLDLESHAAYEWLQTPKGLKKKVLRGFWTRWLTNARSTPVRASPVRETNQQQAHAQEIENYQDPTWRKEHGLD